MKMSDIVVLKPTLDKLLDFTFPTMKQTYKVSKFLKIMGRELEVFEDERIKLVKKYGIDDGQGNYSVKPECFDDFNRDLNELLLVDVNTDFTTFDDIRNLGISTDDFIDDEIKPSSKENMLTPIDLMGLDSFFEKLA